VKKLAMEFLRQMRGFGIDVSGVKTAGECMGVYFVKKGAAMRPSKVVYDRKHSAIASAKPGDINWARAFDGADWLHFTGITPALSDSAAALALEACKTAKAGGLTVSCDLNYRKNLWPRERARAVMTGLSEYIDILIANEEGPRDVFGISAEGSDIDGGMLSEAGYSELAKRLADAYGFKKVALTLRESLIELRDRADIVVVSATPGEALGREWNEHGIAQYVKVIAGQEMGSKKECIALPGARF
jgi:2-dehydro-3-deoxygluconokinase